MLFRFIYAIGLLLMFVPQTEANTAFGQIAQQDKEVALRMIGHQVLLVCGDSTSRVLPIEKDGIAYRIRFENAFAFHPDIVANVIDSVVLATQLAEEYTVQFETCESGQVVHMYKVAAADSNDILACRGRGYPVGCYNVLFTPTNVVVDKAIIEVEQTEESYREVYKLLFVLIAVVILLGGVVVFLLKRTRQEEADPNIVVLGSYRFNRTTMNLMFENERIELTSKEAELLSLLCDSANDTVEREEILKQVWGDEGAYVGRTLDVFISKLRKKLEADSNVRIVNIRGIGYKLVLGD